MQVSETLSDGLKRELKVVVPASELDGRLDTRLQEMKSRVKINGFRPGKVPQAHLKKVYGKSAMAEIVESLVADTTRQALSDRGEKAAARPKIDITEDETEANKILAGEADLVFTMAYEIIPDFEIADFKGVKVEREVADIPDEDIQERLNEIGESGREFVAVERAAKDGDRITMSYLGKVDGEAFEGGADENATLVIGSNRFIPGFEEQLAGIKTGDEKAIEVTFPDDYPAEHLAGKLATFDIVVKEVAEPGEIEFDDAFAERLGMESMEKLRETVSKQIETQYEFASRQKVKRQLLDALDEKHDFPLPESLVEQEFENVWRQVMHDVEQHGKSFEDQGTTEEDARKEYREIAERRVRLGLVLSRIGEDAEVEVTEDELQRALYEQVRGYPGQEQQVMDYYRNNPEAIQALRAPIFEEKTVDYILELSEVTEKKVSKDELLADEEEDGHDHHDHDH
jgi:trigger factor